MIKHRHEILLAQLTCKFLQFLILFVLVRKLTLQCHLFHYFLMYKQERGGRGDNEIKCKVKAEV